MSLANEIANYERVASLCANMHAIDKREARIRWPYDGSKLVF